MWSFGSKREDAQAPSGKMSDGHNQTVPNRSNGDPESDQQQPQLQQLSPKGGGSLAAKSRVFYKNKKLSSSSHHASSNTKNNPNPPGVQPRTPQQEMRKKRFLGGGSNSRRKSVSSSDDDYLQDISVKETSNGIEVSFPGNETTTKALGSKGNCDRAHQSFVSNRVSVQNPVISLREQILERQRLFKSHFSTVLPVCNNNAFSSTNTKKWRPKGHRIPLLGITSEDVSHSESLHLLKSSPVVDEKTAVQQELDLMETEIASLERDRIWLEQSLQSTSSTTGKSSFGSDDISSNKENIVVTWDVHKLLKDDAIKKQPLSVSDRNVLQRQRGNSLTIHLSDSRTQELFVLTFGGKQQNSRGTFLFKNDDSIKTIVPDNSSCMNTGASTLQHVGLISSANKSAGNGGLYFSLDVGKSESIGNLPSKLSQRFEGGESNADGRQGVGDLDYLSTGSRDCYFAKFQSGECWWGSAVEDADFQSILNSWDVHRVAFGPIKTIEHGHSEQQVSSESPLLGNIHNENSNNTTISTNSWIILSHDGKVAWKNLPSRLSKKLETRLANSTAPLEVSLGPGDSYFVRFLDGSIDYSLPSKIARVCERIEERGGNVTNVSLHPDISHDFVIRHTELNR